MRSIRYLQQCLIVLFFLSIHISSFCQVDSEGKKFLEDFFYKLPTHASKIESINILKSQEDKFYDIKAAGALDPDALDAAAKSHVYITLNEYQKDHSNSIQLLQFYDEKTKKSLAKRIIILHEDSYRNFNSLVSLFKSISFSDREAKCKSDEPLCQRVRIFFDNRTKETESSPFIIIQMTELYKGDSIKEKYQLIITLVEENLSTK